MFTNSTAPVFAFTLPIPDIPPKNSQIFNYFDNHLVLLHCQNMNNWADGQYLLWLYENTHVFIH